MRSELDWIVLKALDKDRDRRYATAEALAADLQNYLDGEAVEARPPTRRYRLRTFARRNRAALTAAAILTIVLLTATATSAWQAVRLSRATRVAEQERRASQGVAEFLTRTLEQADPWQGGGRAVTVLQAVDAADRALDGELGDEPVVRAQLRSVIGGVRANLGKADPAVVAAVRDAYGDLKSRLGEDNAVVLRAGVRLADVLQLGGDAGASLALLDALLPRLTRVLGVAATERSRQ